MDEEDYSSRAVSIAEKTGDIEKYRPAADQIFPRSPWEEQLDNFLARLNPGRIADGFPPYTHARVAGILAKKGIHDANGAYELYRKCESGRSFS